MGRKIGICLPMTDHVDAWFSHDLYRAGVHHAFAHPEDEQSLIIQQSSIIPEARNQLAKTALEEGCDYVIMLDTDMRFPQDTYERLMSWEKPVVAANCAKRRRPISPTARREDGDGGLDIVWPEEGKRDLEPIAVTGAAVMCIRSEVFFKLDYPWFETPWHEEEQRFVGEDLVFCAKLREAGIQLYLDHGISWAIGHVGSYTFRMQDCLGERELARQGKWDHTKPDQIVQPAQAFGD